MNAPCRQYDWDICHCYHYVCSCGARYKYDENSYHWTQPGELCMECNRPLPDLACKSGGP